MDHRPSAGEVDWVPSKELLVLSEPNGRTEVVVVKNGTKFRVSKDTPGRSVSNRRRHMEDIKTRGENILSTRRIDIVVALQNQSPAILSARFARLVNLDTVSWMCSTVLLKGVGRTYKTATGVRRPADLNLVLASRRRLCLVKPAALALGEEQIVEVTVLVQVGAFNRVVTVLVRQVDRSSNGLGGSRVHANLLNASPERTESQIVSTTIVEQTRVNGVEVVRRRGGHSGRAMVSPGSSSHIIRRSQSNG